MTMMPIASRGLDSFFSDCSTRHALSELAGHNRLTVVVGAGVSRESGLPGWTDLLNSLLKKAAMTSAPFRSYERQLRSAGISEQAVSDALEEESRHYTQMILGIHGLIGAASVVKSWLPERDFLHYLKQSLYAPEYAEQLEIRPGQTAIEIAQLWRERGPEQLTVVTTNYDLLIEVALLEIGVSNEDIEVATMTQEPATEGRYCVVHLHGLIPHRSHIGSLHIPDNTVILAEDDYYDVAGSARSERMRDYCTRLLEDTKCLFVGTSLTDPNLIGHLYGSFDDDSTPQHYSLNVFQGDQPLNVEADRPALDAGRAAMSKRLEKMGVSLLNADFFCQSALFIREMRNEFVAQRQDLEVPTFTDRLRKWRAESATVGILPDSDAFVGAQPSLQGTLSQGVRAIESALQLVSPLKEATEILSLQLWAHDPFDKTLVFVARSDQQFLSPGSLERHRIGMPIKKLVVEAVCSGAILEAETPDLASSRWGSMLVVPITLDDQVEGLYSLPVGALVLASSLCAPVGLNRLRSLPNERAQLMSVLVAVGRQLLNPRRWSGHE